MSDAGESSDDGGDGDRVEFLYTGQDRSEIPQEVTHVRVDTHVERIGLSAFGGCRQLEEVELGEGLKEIGVCAFRGCKYLKRFRIPPTVKKIGKWAFAECEQLEKVEICDGLEEIGEYAFFACECLKWVRIPPTVKRVGDGVFEDCKQLERMELGRGLEEIPNGAFFGCKCLRRVRIPPTVKWIGEQVFAHCEQLEEVEFCKGLERICEDAFVRCLCLKRLQVPSTVRKIDERAFQDCERLGGVELCEGLEEIGEHAFENCFSLRNIYIPSSLKHIGDRALRGCHNIRKLFGSQNRIFSALRCRLEGLPVHQLCYHQSHQPAQLIFEQLQNMFHTTSDQVESLIPAESLPAHKKGDGKRAATWSRSGRKLKARCHGVDGSDVASGGATASGESHSHIEIPNEIDRNKDCLGMTPLHILACSAKQNLDLYQLIIANRPKCLITKDKWGCLPIFYAISGSHSLKIIQFLIDSQKSTFPDIDLDWDMMVSTLCRAVAPLDNVQRLLEVKQASFAEQSINFQRVAQELTIHCLVRCDSFDEDFPSRWEFMMEFFSDHRAQQGLLESLLEIQQSFPPRDSTTRWQTLCEECVKPLKGWWNLESTAMSSSTFQFLVRCSIPDRLRAIGVRKWQKDIERLVEGDKSPSSSFNHRDIINSTLVFYECKYPQLKEETSLIELALWKSKMGELIATQHDNAGLSVTPGELGPAAKTRCRINCGAGTVISNVLPYLIADAEKDNFSGADGDMDKSSESSSSEEDYFEDGHNEDGNGRSSSDDSNGDMDESSSSEENYFEDSHHEDDTVSISSDDRDDEA